MKLSKRSIFIAGSILILGFVIWRFSIHPSVTSAVVVKARQGPFTAQLYQIGEVKAVNSTNITPRTWGKIADLVAEGSVVEKDQPIAWLESEDLQRNLEQKLVELDLAKKKLAKAEENARLQNYLNELSVQESHASLDFQRNQLASTRAKLEKTRRLVDADISPRKALEDAELNVLSQELQLQNAELALEKTIKNQKSQIELQKADVTSARIDVEKKQSEYDRESDNLTNAVVRAPTSGMVLYKQIWKGGSRDKVAIGDQVGMWHPFLEIPDLSELEVVTFVDEIDISRLAEGQVASIGLDAFPDMQLTGEVTKIASLAQDASGRGESMGRHRGGNSGQSGRKVFEVHISINENPENLRPGVTGRVEIILHESSDAVTIPIEAVFTDSEGQFVFIDEFSGPVRTPITTGAWNHQYICVTEGISPDDEVWLVRPE